MESTQLGGIIALILSIFIIAAVLVTPMLLEFLDNRNKRKFELEKLKLTTSRRYVVVPMALNLINELTSNTSQISGETSTRLIESLNKIIGIIQSDTNDQSQLDEPVKDISEILNTVNVGADITLKLQQIIDWISANQ